MKKFSFSSLALFLFMGMISSCSEDQISINQGAKDSGNDSQVSFAVAHTRTFYESEYQMAWEQNDRIRIFCEQALTVKNAEYGVLPSTSQSKKTGSLLAVSEDALEWGSQDKHHFYAVYPSDGDKVSVSGSIATFKLNLNQTCTFPTTADQSGNYMGEPDMSGAYLAAYTATTPTEEVGLDFKPVMTTLKITVRGREASSDALVSVTGISIISDNVRSMDAQNGVFKYDIKNAMIVDDQSLQVATTETTRVGISSDGDAKIDLLPGQSATFTVFLKAQSINQSNKVKVIVHTQSGQEQVVEIGGNKDKNNQTMDITASSKSLITLPYFPS